MTAILYIGAPALDGAYTGAVNGSSSASHSLSLAIGTANVSRVVVVALVTSGAASAAVSGTPTIGGINATVGTHFNKFDPATGEYGIQYIWAAVPTGTSATVAVTLTSSALMLMHGFSLTGNPAAQVVAQNANLSASTASGGGGTSLSTTVATKVGGVTIGTVSAYQNIATTVTLTAGVTQDVDTNLWTVGGHRVSGHIENTTTEASRTVTANRTGGFAGQVWSIAAISFR